MANMSVNGGADLGADALIGAQEWHISVRGSAGNDVDQTNVVEVAETGDDVSVEMIEVVESLREETLPIAGSFGKVDVPRLKEEGLVLARGYDFAREVVGELCNEDGVRELFEKYRREIEIAVEADVVAFQAFKNAEEWQVGFSSGFVQPFHPMRPCAMVDHVGEMGVKSEGEISQWTRRNRRIGLRRDGGTRLRFAREGELGVYRCLRQDAPRR